MLDIIKLLNRDAPEHTRLRGFITTSSPLYHRVSPVSVMRMNSIFVALMDLRSTPCQDILNNSQVSLKFLSGIKVLGDAKVADVSAQHKDLDTQNIARSYRRLFPGVWISYGQNPNYRFTFITPKFIQTDEQVIVIPPSLLFNNMPIGSGGDCDEK